MRKIGKSVALFSALLLLAAGGACGKKPQKPPVPESGRPRTAPAAAKEKTARLPLFGKEELTIHIQDDRAEQAPPEVRNADGNVAVLARDDPALQDPGERLAKKEQAVRKTLRTKRGPHTLAARLAPLNAGSVIVWSPQWTTGAAGMVRLPAVAKCPDHSIILFVETLGEDAGPCASRLVFMDTHRDRKSVV